MNRSITLTLKILVLIILFSIIFYVIDWRDSYSVIAPDGETLSRVEGRILGDWDGSSINFVPNETSVPEIIREGVRPNGDRIVISPGLPTYIQNLDLFLFIAGALCFVSSLLILNMRWWWLLRANHLKVGVFEIQRLAWIGLFFSNVIPGTTGGDVVKAIYIAKRCSTDKVRALVSVVVDRIIGLLSLLFLACLASLITIDKFPSFAITIWFTGGGAILVCALLLNPRFRKVMRFDQLINRLPERWSKVLSEIDVAVLQYRQHLRGISLWIILSPFVYSLFITSFWLMDRSLGFGLNFQDFLFIVPIASVVQGIPIAPAGWGVGDAVYGYLIGKFGALTMPGIPEAEHIWRTRGVALSVLHRTHIVAWSLIGGILFLINRSNAPNMAPKKNDTKN
jgi:hypothetical protein